LDWKNKAIDGGNQNGLAGFIKPASPKFNAFDS